METWVALLKDQATFAKLLMDLVLNVEYFVAHLLDLRHLPLVALILVERLDRTSYELYEDYPISVAWELLQEELVGHQLVLQA